MAGSGTKHHKRKGLMGLLMIIGLPLVLFFAIPAISGGTAGITAWLSTPLAAIIFLLFLTVALWYCKLEFDEVIMDYFDGGLRKFAILANKVVPFLVWLGTLYAVVKLAFLG